MRRNGSFASCVRWALISLSDCCCRAVRSRRCCSGSIDTEPHRDQRRFDRPSETRCGIGRLFGIGGGEHVGTTPFCRENEMKTTTKHSKPCRPRRDGSPAPAADAGTSAKGLPSAPAIIASAFGKLDLERRARLLGRLLGSVGPLALVVVSGGVFAKYLRNARWSEVPISFEYA